MEFLFLNEEVKEESSLDQMKAFAESVGVDVSDVANQSMEEVMLEAAEGFADAEMTAMQEEFALFQESAGQEQDAEILQESVMKKVGETLKKWWTAIKNFVVKVWAKIVHWFFVALTWMRKTVQSAIQKVSGSKTVYLPKSLATLAGSSVTKDEMLKNINECAKALMDSSENKDGVVKLKTLENGIAKWKKEQLSKTFEGFGKDKEKDAVPVETWKKWMDQALKDYEMVKKAVESANKTAQAKIKENDKALEEFYKSGKGNKESILNKGKKLRASAMVIAKCGAIQTSYSRKIMSALFSKASHKDDKDKGEFKN